MAYLKFVVKIETEKYLFDFKYKKLTNNLIIYFINLVLCEKIW